MLHLVRTGRLGEAFELVAELMDVCDRGLFDPRSRMYAAAAAGSVVAAWSEAGRGDLPRPLGVRPTDCGGTQLTLKLAWQPSGLSRFLGPVVGKTFEEEIAALDALRDLLEGER